MEKFYAGIVLAEQPWIHDDKLSVLDCAGGTSYAASGTSFSSPKPRGSNAAP